MDQVPGQFIIMPQTRRSAQAGPMLKQSKVKRDRIKDILESANPDGGQVPITRAKHNDDMAMVTLSEEQKACVEEANPGLKLYPVYRYSLATVDLGSVMAIAMSTTHPFGTTSPAEGNFNFVVHDNNGSPLPGAKVSLWELNATEPLVTTTDSKGQASIWSQTGLATFVAVSSFAGFWDSYRTGLLASTGVAKFVLQPIDPTFNDCRKFHYGASSRQAGAKVRVAVIDTGIDEHPDLKCVVQRTNHVNSEPDTVVHDNGTGHGTHVAGLIGASGAMQGIAANVEILSYRVFEQGKRETFNFALVQAVEKAVEDGVDIINLSLGQRDVDGALKDRIVDALAAGILVVAAAGNDGNPSVGFPAVMDDVVSVGAVGREGTFPAGTTFVKCLKRAQGTDKLDFVPWFSNNGKVNVAAPGVAVISTVGSNSYTAMNGTSMAAPIITGIAASVLSNDTSLAEIERGPERLKLLKELLYDQCNTLGFGVTDVGSGLPKL
ncbi:S8 family peptidase [Paraburkholderia sp. BCC1884]|uniref:S8 family peptidase n=1 Tax=Paraburkholderia sp. BCC1884 TaxID=2562668 RepID=UPI001183847E|nr:S8 family serine peptidase [Paraburkholderia sp. BCC1884]